MKTMKTMKTYKFRLYPTKKQEQSLLNTLETCRRLRNKSLNERSKNYDMQFYEQKRLLTQRRKQDKYQKQVHSQVLQDVLLTLDKAYQAYFKGLSRYPKFKRRDKYNSFTYTQVGGFNLNGGILRLGMIGKVKIKVHRSITGTVKRCTIIRDIDQWYACISVGEETGQEVKPMSTAKVGVDLGLLNLAVLSNGEVIENPRILNASVQRIKFLQKYLARKKRDSRNRMKAKIALAKAWRKVRRQREDCAHKVSTQLVSKYNIVVFEGLTISRMVKNHSLAAAIMDATWGKLRRITAYKAERRGGRVILVNPGGTSHKCSGCGVIVRKDLSLRVHACPSCSLVMDRDHNAALNILKLGLEQTHAETESLLVRRTSTFQSRKQEAYVFKRR